MYALPFGCVTINGNSLLDSVVTVTSGHAEGKKNARCKYSIYLIVPNEF